MWDRRNLMIKVISVEKLAELIHKHGLRQYLVDLITTLKGDFLRWQEFEKYHAQHFMCQMVSLN